MLNINSLAKIKRKNKKKHKLNEKAVTANVAQANVLDSVVETAIKMCIKRLRSILILHSIISIYTPQNIFAYTSITLHLLFDLRYDFYFCQGRYGFKNIYNSDQNRFQLELHAGRSLAVQNTKKTDCTIYNQYRQL